MSNSNQTPVQQAMPKLIQRDAYKRVPETCETVRGILDDAKAELMKQLEIPEHDHVTVDVILSQSFQRIRDEVAHPFRDEQMRLMDRLYLMIAKNRKKQ